jgi:hypothetical protein
VTRALITPSRAPQSQRSPPGPGNRRRYFALNGTDHRTHADQDDAIAAYLRWHNARAHPERNFAPGSVIRTWTSYQNKVA